MDLAVGDLIVYRYQQRELEGRIMILLPAAVCVRTQKTIGGKVKLGLPRWINRDHVRRRVG